MPAHSTASLSFMATTALKGKDVMENRWMNREKKINEMIKISH